MKRFTLLSLFALLTICVQAYDFKYGDLYYNIIGDNNVEVTTGPNSYNGLTSIIIPSSVDYYGSVFNVSGIGASAFADCISIESVTISNSITYIEDNAFSGCSGLTSISIPSSVTDIGANAFSGVLNVVYSGSATGAPWGATYTNHYADGYLVYTDTTKTVLLICNKFATGEITIASSVTSIEEYAFFGCSGLTSVTIPNRVTNIGEYAFENCWSLAKTYYAGNVTDWCNIDFANNSSNPISYSRNLFINDVLVTDLVIPEGTTIINDYALYGDTCLTSVTIPNSVTSIGDDAFSGCSSLTSVTIPNSVTSIEEKTFSGCIGLTSVTIPNSVTSIGGWGFQGCSSLTSITIPNSVTNIGYNAFEDCWSLAKTYYIGNVTDWCNIDFADNSSNTRWRN